MTPEPPVLLGHVWDLDTVSRVRMLRSQQAISEHEIANCAEPELQQRAIYRRLAEHFIDAARVHAVEVDPGDLAYETREGPLSRVRTITTRWNPEPRALAVHERGHFRTGVGPQIIRSGLLVAYLPRRPSLLGLVGAADRIQFALVGWHETERRWMFTPDATAIAPNEPL